MRSLAVGVRARAQSFVRRFFEPCWQRLLAGSVEGISYRRKRWLIDRSGLFDPKYYLRQCGGDLVVGADPLDHFLKVGESVGLKPNFLFDPIWYRARAMTEAQSVVSPLVHYVLVGARSRISPGPRFNSSDYLNANPDIAWSVWDPLGHFLKFGAAEGRRRSARSGAGHWFGSLPTSSLGRLSDSSAVITIVDCCRPPSGNSQSILHFTHKAGGGTERAVAERVTSTSAGEHHIVLMVENAADGLSISLVVPSVDGFKRLDITLDDVQTLEAAISGLDLTRIVVHQPTGLMPGLHELLTKLAIPFDVVVHDYSLLCPRNSFVTTSGEYCGEPDEAGCRSCLKSKPLAQAVDIAVWRSEGAHILGAAVRVECSLEDVARRIRRYVPRAGTAIRALDAPKPRAYRARVISTNERLRVAVIGHCSTAKGGEFLLNCVSASLRANQEIDWFVVGSLVGVDKTQYRRLRQAILVTGDYEPGMLDELLSEIDPHLIFFPQHCIETWSFALSEALESGRAILGPDLGAFGERLSGVAGASLYAVYESPSTVVNHMAAIRESLGSSLSPRGFS